MDTNLIDRKLPKWPQMIVTGRKISEESALEIIRRTDSFFSYPSGNNHSFIKEAKRAMKFMDVDEYKPEFPYEEKFEDYWSLKEEYLNRWGYINLEYVHNSWISSSFIGGVHGWCHPDGTIVYSDNVGKWPSVAEIYNEWIILAEAFPFLEIGVTLMSGEDCEEDTYPVVSMEISEGKVELVDPSHDDVHGTSMPKIDSKDKISSYMKNFFTRSENAIPLNILQEWGVRIFGNDNIFSK